MVPGLNEQNNKTLSVEERFLELEKTYPNALQRIPVEQYCRLSWHRGPEFKEKHNNKFYKR